MSEKRILSVGQCSMDHGTISRTVAQQFGAQVVGADDIPGALARLRAEPFALVLVNRVFDADGTEGLDLIRQIKADPALTGLPVMLVSNFPEAQAEAVGAGALPGFGKATLADPATKERLTPFLS